MSRGATEDEEFGFRDARYDFLTGTRRTSPSASLCSCHPRSLLPGSAAQGLHLLQVSIDLAEQRGVGVAGRPGNPDLTHRDPDQSPNLEQLPSDRVALRFGVMAAKQLGADKRISMWRVDSQVGMVILQAPPVPKIDHEVPILPPKHSDEEEIG